MRPAAASLVVVLFVVTPRLADNAHAQVVVDPTLRLESVVSGLIAPTTMAFVGDDEFLVLEKTTGRVRRVIGGVLDPFAVLDVAVAGDGERGLLGIAVNSEEPPRVFLYFTEAEDPTGLGVDGGAPLANRVYRYTWNAALGALENGELIVDLPENPLHGCHKGGVLALGARTGAGPGDGAPLFIVIGDLGLTTLGEGQLTNESGGTTPDDRAVILRVRQDGSPVPDNPFVPYCESTSTRTCTADADCPLGERCFSRVANYFAYGIRNSFGIAIDPVTGDLWETENGPFNYDEINRVEPGTNGGWLKLMGPEVRDPQSTSDLWNLPGAGLTYSDPEFSWRRPVAVTAILFPVGSTLGAAYDEVALVGDAKFGQIYRFPLDAARHAFDLTDHPELNDRVADGDDGAERDLVLLGTGFTAVTDLKLGDDGNVYIVDYGAGAVMRLVPTCPPTPRACREPAVQGKSRITLVDDHDDSRDRISWKWKKGAATTKEEFGDPVASDSFALCVYDFGGLVASTVASAGGQCAGKPCWSERTRGFRYRDRSVTGNAIQFLKLKAGENGKAAIGVRARGTRLGLPPPPSLASPLTVQLHRGDGTGCWGAGFSFPPALKNTERTFKDRSE